MAKRGPCRCSPRRLDIARSFTLTTTPFYPISLRFVLALPLVVIGKHRVDIISRCKVLVDLKPRPRKYSSSSTCVWGTSSDVCATSYTKEFESARGGDFGVQLAHGARGRIARVGIERLCQALSGFYLKGPAQDRGDARDVPRRDVTHNIRTIDSVPLELARPTILSGGEGLDEPKDARLLNKIQTKLGKPLYCQPAQCGRGRRAPAGPQNRRLAPIDSFVYDVAHTSEDVPQTQVEELEYLRGLGLRSTSTLHRLIISDAVLAYYDQWKGKNKSQGYWIDGVVVKVNERAYQDALGSPARRRASPLRLSSQPSR